MTINHQSITENAFQLDLLIECETDFLPSKKDFSTWAHLALRPTETHHSELSVKIIDNQKSAELNEHYRRKPYPTNVLSFPYRGPTLPAYRVYGDLVLCAPVIAQEALSQHISVQDHWAHIFIHGCLHLIGYDHISPEEAEEMENKEIALLESLHIANPYN
jgi:probable rRNA maturation factor